MKFFFGPNPEELHRAQTEVLTRFANAISMKVGNLYPRPTLPFQTHQGPLETAQAWGEVVAGYLHEIARLAREVAQAQMTIINITYERDRLQGWCDQLRADPLRERLQLAEADCAALRATLARVEEELTLIRQTAARATDALQRQLAAEQKRVAGLLAEQFELNGLIAAQRDELEGLAVAAPPRTRPRQSLNSICFLCAVGFIRAPP